MTDYRTDHRGARVPVEMIKPEHLLEDELVRKLTASAESLSAALADFKDQAFGEVTAYRALIAEQYGARKGGAKGNVTLTSFDGRLQVQLAVSESIAFGPELQAAKELIDNCVTRWAADANTNLCVMVDHAFQVGKSGRIDTGRVLGLRRLEISDPEWERAMDAISDAVRITGSKTYLRVYRRDPKTEHKTPIPLDLASV